MKPQPFNDPIVAEIHKHRQEFADRYDNDTDAIFQAIKEMEFTSDAIYIRCVATPSKEPAGKE